MRDVFIVLIFLVVAFRTLSAPQAGILGWTWLTLLTPHQLTFGFASTLPLNLLLVLITLGAWTFSREDKKLPWGAPTVLLIVFAVFCTISTTFALEPAISWPKWNLAIKSMALGLAVAAAMQTRIRLHALIWMIVLSLGYYGVKGGLFTLFTGGGSHVYGPPNTSLADNNDLALALCLSLPLMNYLRLHSQQRYTRMTIVFAMAVTAIAVLGTYSRGGLVALGIMGVFLWWTSSRKMLLTIASLVVLIPAFYFMPSDWTDRMATIQTANQDSSFQERVAAWIVSYHIALAHPITGGGFSATESPFVYRDYNDGQPMYAGTVGEGGREVMIGRAAHSIYFQILGGQGFGGLAIYLAMLFFTWRSLSKTRARCRGQPDLEWAADLSSMAQVSLLSFLVAGAALAMAYYDLVFLIVGIAIALNEAVPTRRTNEVADIKSWLKADSQSRVPV
jgi:probable O-glycosylation ligase (exosortase A-associated)